MCDLVADSVTVTGPYEAFWELDHGWKSLRTVRSMSLEPPHAESFKHLETNRPFDDRAPTVARVHHKWGAGAPVAERLQVEMLMRHIPVFIEAEHHVGLSSAASGASGRPSVHIDPTAIAAVDTDAVRGSATGSRVAVVDSGDILGKPQMSDFTGGLAGYMPAEDLVGHGTAVAEVIRQISPHADVSALRVVNAQRGTSYELLCAMTYALWSGMFDVVNVSLSTQASNTCMSVLGGSLDMILDICRSNGAQLPQIVAAAGNITTGQEFGYPASLPGCTVVKAWDFKGELTSYNVPVPPTHQPVHATGGDAVHAFGTIIDGTGKTEPMYGTSFAAAVATALLVS